MYTKRDSARTLTNRFDVSPIIHNTPAQALASTRHNVAHFARPNPSSKETPP